MTETVLEALWTQYGPVAFGLVALLILWARIVKPQLDDAKLDRDAQHATATTLHETAMILRECVKDLKRVRDDLGLIKKRDSA